jgi:hypothetical protein
VFLQALHVLKHGADLANSHPFICQVFIELIGTLTSKIVLEIAVEWREQAGECAQAEISPQHNPLTLEKPRNDQVRSEELR